MVFRLIFILMSMNGFYTYLLIDPETDRPFYVGKGRGHRMTIHERRAKLGKVSNNNLWLYNKIRKILDKGLCVKYKTPVKNVSSEKAFEWEVRLERCLRNHGYDLCNIGSCGKGTRGNLGKKHTDEMKLKMREINKGRFTLQWFINQYGDVDGRTKYRERSEKISQLNRGRKQPPITEETRRKMRESHVGHQHSEETKKKIAIANTGIHVGKIVSEETREKLSKARKGKPCPMRGKKHKPESIEKMKWAQVKTYTLIDPAGAFHTMTNLKDFCERMNLNYSSIHQVAAGRRNGCNGWTRSTM